MDAKQNAAVVALSRVLEDAAGLVGTPARDILVQALELRSRTEEPSPLPPAYFIQLGQGLSYWADTQGNISRAGDNGGTDTEVRVRFEQAGGIGGWRSEYGADESRLSPGDAAQLRQHIHDTNFFHLPDEVGNGKAIADGYSYTVWIAVGRNNKTVKTYDGSGPSESPALVGLISWLKARAPEPGPAMKAETT